MTLEMNPLSKFREKIDLLDDQIVTALAARYKLQEEIAATKIQHNLPVVIEERALQVIEQNVRKGVEQGLPEEFVKVVYDAILKAAHDCQAKHFAEKKI